MRGCGRPETKLYVPCKDCKYGPYKSKECIEARFYFRWVVRNKIEELMT